MIQTCWTRRARDLDRPVGDLVEVGGGAVACEYASIFLVLGTRVTLVDRGSRLLPFVDAQLSDELARIFASFGVTIRFHTSVSEVRRDAEGLLVDLGDAGSMRPEKIIFAEGRIGSIESHGLEAAGVETDDRRRILVDGHYETSAHRVYAAGDVIGPPALASSSMEQGRVAACHVMAISFKTTVDPVIPFGVYSIPECATVGFIEEQARDQGIDCEIGIAWLTDNSRAAIAGSPEGS